MSRADVESVLGTPTAKVQIDRGEGRVLRERWEYGESAGTVAPSSSLGYAPPDDVFVVFFGTDGRMTDARRPLTGRYAETGTVAAPSR
ncbi:MAG: hypothetical protein ACYSU7_14090 [Planctomycetota bacterium]